MSTLIEFPRIVVFEGVDGVGKSTFAELLSEYHRERLPATSLYAGSFPGQTPGTLGEWVYRFHHNRLPGAPAASSVAPAALQLLHVAAHIDAITTRIAPIVTDGGNIILDRYWWSTYAYLREHATIAQAMAIVGAEQVYWAELPRACYEQLLNWRDGQKSLSQRCE